ncbi:MAG: S49 family peptidase, partial [Planctomycetes bacterium]|nr:S49 family peptidase [Planctomycetota bacterium]
MSDSKIFTTVSESDSDDNQRGRTKTAQAAPQTVVIQTSPSFWRSWAVRMLMAALGFSIMLNFGFYSAYQEYFSKTEPPIERYHSGSKTSEDKVALIKAEGTIMPPFTERLIDQIKHAGKDDSVKGIVLQIDSPGGLVADSHEIYHRLKQIKKPIYVQMKRLAASGGYYIAMGAGPEAKIYAEPTTWTGSIGVIIPRYDFSELAEKYGVRSDPLKTGEFKDALNPF